MRKHIIFLLVLSIISNANAVATAQRRGGQAATPSAMGGGTTVSARAAVRTNTSTKNATPAAARSATTGRTMAPRGTATVSQPAAVGARAATTQKAVNTGTKVTTATQNTAVDQTCQQKFNGCMDSFCMIENTSGGRCQCSAQITELTEQLQEIEKLNQQSYQLATIGVETIETGVDIAKIEQVSKEKINLSQWDVDLDTEEPVKAKTGMALQNEAAALCLNKMPECANSAQILRTMYNQQVRSDCAAYANAIKQERAAAENKLNEAKRAMRSSAYDKLKESNKYDLGQCTTEFKKCMITTGGCGEDFSNCASVSAMDNTNTRKSSKAPNKTYAIKGSATTIEIFASTYDTLEGKKPLCMSITDSCVNVKDQVWNTFLREVAPQIKSAELIAEDKTRQECAANISACFQKACKDTMDPNDPDGSYDMCLSRPETMLNVCKMPLNACGINTDKNEAEKSQIWQYVVARLAAMRVDSCTQEVKECLTSDERCGQDYAQCVGLDTDTIIKMCPYDKLTGCQKVYKDTDIRGDAVYDELVTMVQGIMLNIDNNMLDFCQNAANESMIRVCGDTENCDTLTTNDSIGAGSLNYGICYYRAESNDASIDYTKCFADASQIRDVDLGRVEGSTTGELGPVVPLMSVMDGVMFWELVTIDDNGNLTSADEYFKLAGTTQMSAPTQELVKSQLSELQIYINNAVQAIETDPTVQYCMTGRKVQGMKNAPIDGTKAPRFPRLTKQMRILIANSALKTAKENYYKKYDELSERQMKDYVTIAERQAQIKGENSKDVRREAARQSCVSLADMAALPMSPPPPTGIGMWIVAGVVTVIGAVVTVVTFGAAGAPVGAGLSALWIGISSSAYTLTTLGTVAAVGVGAAAVGTGMLVGSTVAEARANHDKGSVDYTKLELSGHHELNQWNWKQEIDTTFEWDSLQCHKCVKSTKCIKQSYPMFGRPKCKQWAESTTECTDTQF